ncbi:MAG: zf-HC2 domain-containing protein [Candidatus Aminicenantes bacterium]|jgi:anti-sigma factor RsiW
MQCKDIERLIIVSSEEELSPEESRAVEQHLEHCAHCASLRDDLEKIRLGITTMPKPVLPLDLAQKTRERCLDEMRLQPASAKRVFSRFRSYPVPTYVWAALIPLVILTVLLVAPVIKEIRLDKSLTFESAAALTLLIQNAAMLFFAPILIRKYRSQRKNMNGFPMNANAS